MKKVICILIILFGLIYNYSCCQKNEGQHKNQYMKNNAISKTNKIKTTNDYDPPPKNGGQW